MSCFRALAAARARWPRSQGHAFFPAECLEQEWESALRERAVPSAARCIDAGSSRAQRATAVVPSGVRERCPRRCHHGEARLRPGRGSLPGRGFFDDVFTTGEPFWGFEKTWFAIRSQKLGPCIMMYDVSQHQKKNNFFLEFTHVFFYSSSPAQCARRVRRRTAAMGDPPSRTIREDDLLFWSQKMLGLDARPGGARWRCCQTCALRAPCWARRLRKPAADATTPLPMRAHTHLHQCWRTFVMACSWSGSCSAC